MDVRGKKVTIVGMGQTALAVVRLLLREGASPFVTDSGGPDKLEPICVELDALKIPYEIGKHSDGAFDGASVVIPSPGVPPHIDPIRRARETGATVIGEMEFAFPYCRSRILAVTGTNGKTTTTELLRVLIRACGHEVVLAGNNAFPFSAAVMMDPAPQYVVLEVSSYQLETAHTFRPWIGAVLNVTPDHLSRHGTLEEYAAIKARIFAHQQPGDHAVINADDVLVRGMTRGVRAQVWPFSVTSRQTEGLWLRDDTICLADTPVAHIADTRLPGRHNVQNVLCALSMMRAGGFDWEKTLAGLRTFSGVEHRIEHVAGMDGIEFYNDSKSTNVDSLRVALESFDRPVVLIAGGRGKGSDYGVLRPLIHQRVRMLITLGEDAPTIEAAFGDLVRTQRASDMADAVQRAAAAAQAGNVVLLSPACASFDMYENFEHRGRAYKQCVTAYLATRTQEKEASS